MILQPYPAITKQAVPTMVIYPNTNLERKTGMIDAAEQEIEECIQKIDDIQYIFDNPVDGDDNMAYKEKQEDLKCMQARGKEKIKQLLLEIRNIQEYDDMDDGSDTQSVTTKSSNTTGKDPTTALYIQII